MGADRYRELTELPVQSAFQEQLGDTDFGNRGSRSKCLLPNVGVFRRSMRQVRSSCDFGREAGLQPAISLKTRQVANLPHETFTVSLTDTVVPISVRFRAFRPE